MRRRRHKERERCDPIPRDGVWLEQRPADFVPVEETLLVEQPHAAAAATGHEPVEPVRGYSLLWAMIVAVVFPSRAAAGMRGRSLLAMWLTHVCGALLSGAATLALFAYFDPSSVWSLGEFVDRLFLFPSSVARYDAQDPTWFLGIAALVVLGIELAFVLLALIFMPAGARDEPLHCSFGNALRQTWLSTARIGVILFLVGGLACSLDYMETHRTYLRPPDYPDQPREPNRADFPADAAYQRAMATYDQEMIAFKAEVDKYWEAKSAYSAAMTYGGEKPWYLKNWDLLILLAASMSALWHLLALIRGIGAPRDVAPAERPPLCEYCGYNLIATAADARCSECGMSVRKSLGEGVRNGPAWEHRTGIVEALCNTADQAARQPIAFGRSLRVTRDGRAAQGFGAAAVPIFVLVGTGALFVTIVTFESPTTWPGLHIVLPILLSFGIACACGAIVVSHLAALLIGWLHGRSVHRNLLPAAYQGACYLAGLLVAWEIIGAVVMAVMMHLGSSGAFDDVGQATGLGSQLLVAAFFLLPNLLCLTWFLVQLSRITAACKYANR